MLTDDEVRALVSKAQQGDKSSLDVLFEKFKPFRHALASSYANKGVDLDDIIQEIDCLFIQSVKEYDSSLDSSALRHIVSSTRQRVYVYYRNEINHSNRNLPQGLTIGSDSIEMDTSLIEVDEYVNSVLNSDEKDVVLLRSDGYMQTEIANKLGVSEATVSRLLASARQKLTFFLNL